MDKVVSVFAKNWLIENIRRCNSKEIHLFKRMYSHKNLDAEIVDIINNIPDDKLDWAVTQVKNTIDKKQVGSVYYDCYGKRVNIKQVNKG